ncbi:MAG: hypothetical protein KCHDKBKB_03081 [Elusimicrobia bacterium]|nr:hypothetical protein [Elusimicrobiota bacterium]
MRLISLRNSAECIAFLLVAGVAVFADDYSPDGTITLEPIIVRGRQEDLIGEATSASQGRTGQNELDKRPLLRTGEVMELVPGLIITQHSGTGKANQYFLRGFNLDHGTDFSVNLDGVPLNLPTHGHGQGYLDLNFLIPELIDYVDYKKGPYYAEIGDFSSAGGADIHYYDKLPMGFAKLGVGENQFLRGVVGNSHPLGRGHLLYAVDSQYDNGPWQVPENYRKFSGVLRYSCGNRDSGNALTAMGYSGQWNSTDQIPERAVDQGIINRLGSLDPSDGGETSRLGFSADAWTEDGRTKSKANLFLQYYRLNLWSNFTYFLDDPVHGDQFEQQDQRIVAGGSAEKTWRSDFLAGMSENTIGLQVRHDNIPNVALKHTEGRTVIDTVREDRVKESTAGLYVKNSTQWFAKVRSILGLRGDGYLFDVHSNIAENSGTARDRILSPKMTLILGPWAETEFYANGGYGFHSNDARGTTIKVDPTTKEAADPVSPLVRSKGAEAGIRTSVIPHFQSTLSLWILDLDSELLFTGDAGTTEPSRPSRRNGVEWANFYRPISWLTFDGDIAFTHAEFTDQAPEGNEVPGALERVASAGVAVNSGQGIFGSFRLRYFGGRPLTEDNSVRSQSSTICNFQMGYQTRRLFNVTLDILNIFDSPDHDIDYYYTSRLQGEPMEGIEDIHFHPVEPRTVRIYVSSRF